MDIHKSHVAMISVQKLVHKRNSSIMSKTLLLYTGMQIVHACINRNGIIIISVCNIRTSFDKNRITVGCFILKSLSSLNSPYGLPPKYYSDSAEFYFSVGPLQRKKGRKKEKQLNCCRNTLTSM